MLKQVALTVINTICLAKRETRILRENINLANEVSLQKPLLVIYFLSHCEGRIARQIDEFWPEGLTRTTTYVTSTDDGENTINVKTDLNAPESLRTRPFVICALPVITYSTSLKHFFYVSKENVCEGSENEVSPASKQLIPNLPACKRFDVYSKYNMLRIYSESSASIFQNTTSDRELELVEYEHHRKFEATGDFCKIQLLRTDLSLAQQWIGLKNTEVLDIHCDFCSQHVRKLLRVLGCLETSSHADGDELLFSEFSRGRLSCHSNMHTVWFACAREGLCVAVFRRTLQDTISITDNVC